MGTSITIIAVAVIACVAPLWAMYFTLKQHSDENYEDRQRDQIKDLKDQVRDLHRQIEKIDKEEQS